MAAKKENMHKSCAKEGGVVKTDISMSSEHGIVSSNENGHHLVDFANCLPPKSAFSVQCTTETPTEVEALLVSNLEKKSAMSEVVPSNTAGIVEDKIEQGHKERDVQEEIEPKIENELNLSESSKKFGNKEIQQVMEDQGNEDEEVQLMKEEELKAEEKNKVEEKRLMKKILDQHREEKQLVEKRHKRLLHLLTKSQFYSQFLLEKIKSQMNKENEGRNCGANTHRDVLHCNGDHKALSESVESTSSGNRKQKAKSQVPGAPACKKQKIDSKYKVTDVLNKEDVVRAVLRDQGEEDKEEGNTTSMKQPQLLTGAQLRPYQLDGFNWLRVMYENGVNGLLADEMGLGKTVQTIALLCHLVEMGVKGPFLVVAPLSTLHNWCNEIRTFAPQLPYVLFHGSEPQRRSKLPLIRKVAPVTTTTPEGKTVTRHVLPIVVTSYEMAVLSERSLSTFMWRHLTVDEGHRIKNFKCRLIKSLKQYCSNNRLLLTGTPLQNSLAELWSLLNFLLPEVFDSLDVFESWFDVSRMADDGAEERILQQEQEKQVISTLHKILSPFLLRRLKKDVALHLPPKRELLVYAHMTELQLLLYRATLEKNMDAFTHVAQKEEVVEYDTKGRPLRRCTAAPQSGRLQQLLSEDDSPAAFERFLQAMVERQAQRPSNPNGKEQKQTLRVRLQNRIMQCRRVVNHPYLISYPLTPDGQYKVDEELVRCCGKLQVLDQLLGELHQRKHKVLLFSQMTQLLDILDDYLSLRPQYNYRRLDGSVKLEDRQRDIDDFNKNPDMFLFLLSTRAGSLGLNLTAADTVVIYDSDWNPQQDLQAQDRCHRIGQTRPVLVLRLVTAASVDEHIVQRANSKRCLEKLIIKANVFKGGPKAETDLDREELLRLLEERDHHSVYRSDKRHGVFSSDELARILDRSDLQGRSLGPSDSNNNKSSEGRAGSNLRNPAANLLDVFKVLQTEQS